MLGLAFHQIALVAVGLRILVAMPTVGRRAVAALAATLCLFLNLDAAQVCVSIVRRSKTWLGNFILGALASTVSPSLAGRLRVNLFRLAHRQDRQVLMHVAPAIDLRSDCYLESAKVSNAHSSHNVTNPQRRALYDPAGVRGCLLQVGRGGVFVSQRMCAGCLYYTTLTSHATPILCL